MTSENTALALNQGPTELTKVGLEHTADQLKLLEGFVNDVLIEGQDYGIIPGTERPTLFKPGAANIIAAFGCHSEPTTLLSNLDVAGNFVAYEHRVDIINNGTGGIVASGMGGCNSHEPKYRYRHENPECPACGLPNIRESNRGDGDPFYCWKKTGGCGKTFSANHPVAELKPQRIENPDQLDLANTCMKMSIKRAEVDAALKLPGVARKFTQDLEDMGAGPTREDNPSQDSTPRSSGPVKTSNKNTRRRPAGDTITVDQAQKLMADAEAMLGDNGRKWVMETIKDKWDLNQPGELNAAQLTEMEGVLNGAPDANQGRLDEEPAEAQVDH